MAVLRRTGTQIGGSADPLWWGLAATLGLLSLWLPHLLSLEATHLTQVLVVESALFFSGALVGCLRPRRVWRWAAASYIAFAIRDIFALMADTAYAGAIPYAQAVIQFGDHAPLYLVQCLPVLAGAYIGYFISSAGLR
ncbi:MAG: hypothetical protein ABSD27_03485 [Bryobacteraceae bacterium]|jgi:hypothetical protein